MKKKFLIFTLFLLVLTGVFAGDFTLTGVKDSYVGVYIPVDIENQIKSTKLLYSSFRLGYPLHHDMLFLGKTKCYSDVHFHDGYAITAKDFKNFRFVQNENGFYCIDQNGNSYKKISSTLNERGYGYAPYMDYVLNLIFDSYAEKDKMNIKDGTFSLDGTLYNLLPDGMFLDTRDVSVWLKSEDGIYALKKNGKNGELYKGYKDEDEMFYLYGDEKLKEFPSMF